MRSVRGTGGVRSLAAPAVLVALLGVGCGGHQASGQGLPESPEPVATVVVDGLVPGDRRAPDAKLAATTTTRPIAVRAGATTRAVPPGSPK